MTSCIGALKDMLYSEKSDKVFYVSNATDGKK